MPSHDDEGKGLVGPHPKDNDPNRYQLLGLPTILEVAGAPANEFDTGSGLTEPPPENQGSSQSCTWQSFSYYFWQWTGIQLSRQDGYSRTHLPGGGGYLIDPFRTMMEGATGGGFNGQGDYDRSQHQDPTKQTEANMIIKVNLPGQKRKVFKIRYWYVPYNDIYAVARAIKQYKGIVFGVWYNSTLWADRTHPKPVSPSQASTAHALYGFDVGWDRGQEAIKADSSWLSAKYHWIINDYFKVGGVFSPIAMEVKELNDMDQVLFVVSNGRYGFISINDGRIIGGALAANVDEVKTLRKVFEYPKEVVNPDGSFIPVDATLNY